MGMYNYTYFGPAVFCTPKIVTTIKMSESKQKRKCGNTECQHYNRNYNKSKFCPHCGKEIVTSLSTPVEYKSVKEYPTCDQLEDSGILKNSKLELCRFIENNLPIFINAYGSKEVQCGNCSYTDHSNFNPTTELEKFKQDCSSELSILESLYQSIEIKWINASYWA